LFSSDFMPHGHCFLWRPELVWLHVTSDSLIAAAYYSIPFTLFYVARRRRSIQMRGLVLMFAGFILACGTTHLMSVWDLWHSAYRLEGVIKAITAGLSIATAIATVKLTPLALQMPTPGDLERANQSLRQEIEARKEAEQKLRAMIQSERNASEAKIRSYFEAASQGIIAVSSDGNITLVNRRTEEMFGYHRSELLGQPLELLLPERYRRPHDLQVADYFAHPRMRPVGGGMELAARRKDGTEFPVEIGLSHVQTEEGRLALGLVSDVTERRRAADELARALAVLRDREAQWRSLLEAASQGILAISPGGEIVLVNRRMEELFGYSRDEMIGQRLEMLLPERFRGSHIAHRGEFFRELRVRPMGVGLDLAGRRKDGAEFPVEIGLSYIETGRGVLAMGLVSDITERKRAADELAHAVEELRRSNAELEQFAYVASHDLQEPLRMITGYLNILQRRYSDRLDADGEEFIRYAVDGATRMKTMIREILGLSRVGTQAVNRLHVPGAEIVRCAMDNLTAAIGDSSAEIIVGPLPTLFVDPGLLVLAFQNLIGNAIKFRGSRTPLIRIGAAVQGRECILSVQDNGIGMNPEHLERIFRIFERLHTAEEYPGTGVGLAIAKKIVERHGGKIRVESKPGEGSTFYISLPTTDTPTH